MKPSVLSTLGDLSILAAERGAGGVARGVGAPELFSVALPSELFDLLRRETWGPSSCPMDRAVADQPITLHFPAGNVRAELKR